MVTPWYNEYASPPSSSGTKQTLCWIRWTWWPGTTDVVQGPPSSSGTKQTRCLKMSAKEAWLDLHVARYAKILRRILSQYRKRRGTLGKAWDGARLPFLLTPSSCFKNVINLALLEFWWKRKRSIDTYINILLNTHIYINWIETTIYICIIFNFLGAR